MPTVGVDTLILQKLMTVGLKNQSRCILLGVPLNGLCMMPLKTVTGWELLEIQTATKDGLELVILELDGLVRLAV